MLRSSQAQLLPAARSDFAASIAGYDDELHKLPTACGRRRANCRNCWPDAAYSLAVRIPRTARTALRAAEVPYVNFAEIANSVAQLEQSAKAFDKAYARLRPSTIPGAKRHGSRVMRH